MDNLQGTPNAFYCEQTQMFGKAFTVVGKTIKCRYGNDTPRLTT